MAISLDDYEEVLKRRPKTDEREKRGDEIDLSDEDEAALDRAWEKVAEENKSSKVSV